MKVTIGTTTNWRIQCGVCKRYMRFRDPTPKTPAVRRPPPHAGTCVDCEPPHVLCDCPVQKPLPW